MPRRETDDDYNIETIMGAWLYEYEDLIAEVLGIDKAEEHVQQGLDLLSSPGSRRSSFTNAYRADNTPWSRLNEIMKSRGVADDEAISDSESVVSIGELGPDARFSTYDLEQEIADEPEDSFAARQRRKSTGNENTWEVSGPLEVRNNLRSLTSVVLHSTYLPKSHCFQNRPTSEVDEDQALAIPHCVRLLRHPLPRTGWIWVHSMTMRKSLDLCLFRAVRRMKRLEGICLRMRSRLSFKSRPAKS